MSERLPVLSTEHWPSPRKLTALVHGFDNLIMFQNTMRQAKATLHPDRLWECETAQQSVQDAKRLERRWAKHQTKLLAELDNLLDDCQPANWSDEHAMVQKSELSKLVAILLGSFPTSNIPDVAVFVHVLLDDLIALGPCRPGFVETEAAFRELRRTKKFTPSICEIIAAIERQEAQWEERYIAGHTIGETHAELIAAIGDAERMLTAIEARRTAQSAITKPEG